MSTPNKMLLFGASGTLGASICDTAKSRGWDVISVDRHDPRLSDNAPYSSVCWAQGVNLNDSIYDFNMSNHMAVYEANCAYILTTLHALLANKLLDAGSRLCIVSSIWQEISRPNKLSYSVSKAALHGLVLSAASDLARDGHLINAVLPGAMDTAMTRSNLTNAQIASLEQSVGFNRLINPSDVASLVCYLCSEENTGVTGQSIAVDLGYSHVRIV